MQTRAVFLGMSIEKPPFFQVSQVQCNDPEASQQGSPCFLPGCIREGSPVTCGWLWALPGFLTP